MKARPHYANCGPRFWRSEPCARATPGFARPPRTSMRLPPHLYWTTAPEWLWWISRGGGCSTRPTCAYGSGVCEEEGLSYCGSSRGGASPRRGIEEDDEEVVRPGGGYGPRGYGSPGFRSEPRGASVCVTARGNCATRRQARACSKTMPCWS